MKCSIIPSCALALVLALTPPPRVLGQPSSANVESQNAGSAQDAKRQNPSPNQGNHDYQLLGANNPQGQNPKGQSSNGNKAPAQPRANPPSDGNKSQGQPKQSANANNGPSGVLVLPEGNWYRQRGNMAPNVDWQYGWQLTGQPNQPQGALLTWVDQASRNSGMTLAPADAALRAHLKLPEGQGLIVTAVEPGSPATAVGIQQNDVLIRVAPDAKSFYDLAKPEDLEAALKNLGERPITIDLLRGGHKMAVKVQPKIHASLGPVRSQPNPYWIGVSVGPLEPALRAQLQLPEKQGLIVLEVEKDGPAAKAGVHQFDILTKFDGVALVDQAELIKLVQSRGTRSVAVELLREGKTQELRIAPQLRQVALNIISDVATDGAWDLVIANGSTLVPLNSYTATAPNPLLGNVTYTLSNDFSVAPTAKAKPDADPSVEKKIDELTAQIKELRQAVEALAKSQAKR